MEASNINQHSEERFFDLMDRLVEWQKHEKREPLELLSISVFCNHTNSNKLFQEIFVVGYINDSENDIKRAMMSNAPGDKAFIEDMNEWFLFGNPIGGSSLSYYQTCSFDSSSDLSDVLSNLEKKCIEKYNNASIDFSIPQRREEGGCYIATCVYGSYDCPEVWTLRRFRDYKLTSSWLGRSFIDTYYAISPTIVRLFGKTKWFNHFWKGKLDRMVNHLQKKGYQATPYYDR